MGIALARQVVQLLALLIWCATVNYQPYEGKNNLHEGQGGSKLTISGVDFWANGAPPRKYTLIGIIDSEIGEGLGDVDIIRSAVATQVKQRGGQGVIAVGGGSSFGGVMPIGGLFMALNNKKIRYQVIKYMD